MVTTQHDICIFTGHLRIVIAMPSFNPVHCVLALCIHCSYYFGYLTFPADPLDHLSQAWLKPSEITILLWSFTNKYHTVTQLLCVFTYHLYVPVTIWLLMLVPTDWQKCISLKWIWNCRKKVIFVHRKLPVDRANAQGGKRLSRCRKITFAHPVCLPHFCFWSFAQIAKIHKDLLMPP